MLPFDPNDFLLLDAMVEPIIVKVLTQGGAKTPVPHDEPSAVASVTVDGFSEIIAQWRPHFRTKGYRIDAKPVFVHSRPQVKWPRNKRCELADLLVVFDHVDKGAIIDRRAILVQAKRIHGIGFGLNSLNIVQGELLSKWPVFEFADQGYDRRKRDFRAKCPGWPGESAQYGIVDLATKPRYWFQTEIGPTGIPLLAPSIRFGELLAGMVFGLAGFGRQAVSGGADDWSFTVDELLTITAAKPITIKSGIAAVSPLPPVSWSGALEAGRRWSQICQVTKRLVESAPSG